MSTKCHPEYSHAWIADSSSPPTPTPIFHCPLITNKTLPFSSAFMSHHTPLHNVESFFNNALNSYQKRTKNNLLAHPLAAQLQACNSPGDILVILQQQVQGLDQSQSNEDRRAQWLDPTVNTLSAFSVTLGEDVGLVSHRCKLV